MKIRKTKDMKKRNGIALHNPSLEIKDLRAGITLIALVITIIVLLILAGVSIAMLTGESGILTKAQTASEDTKRQGALEKVKIAVAGSIDNNGKYNVDLAKTNIEKEVEGSIVTKNADNSLTVKVDGYTIEVSSTGKVSEPTKEGGSGNNVTPGVPVAENTEYSDGTEIAIIPKGFKVSTKTDEQKISEGLVVIAPDESEFVWVPVPTPISDTETEATTNKAMAVNLGTTENPQYRGLLYNFTETTSEVRSGCTTTTSDYREPAYLTENSNGDASSNNTIGITETSLQTEYNSIISSIETNKGFYVGRYETSNTTATESSAGTSGNIQAKAGVMPTTDDNSNTNMWYGLYDKEQKYASTLEGTNIKSAMITGSQYDAMLNWALKGNDKDKVTATENGNHSGELTTTGNATYIYDKINNIYDLEGNVSEWTSEAYDTYSRVFRGGYYTLGSETNYREYYSPDSQSGHNGSRITLYL